MNGIAFAQIGALLLVACLIAVICRRFGWPYAVGLAAAGIGIAYLPNAPVIPLSRDLIFNVFLPPLVFEAALQLGWSSFRRELPVTLLLAFVGVAIAAAIVAAGMHWIIGWGWIGAALFGVLIAATDPVSVIASFRELKVEHRLSMLVESESLLNDGVAAVGFVVLVGIATGISSGPAGALLSFLWTMGGGTLIGIAAGLMVLFIAKGTADHLVEITLTTIAAYGSFLLAEHFHASGVFASLAAGLTIGNLGWKGAISAAGREHLLSAWEYFAFLANSFRSRPPQYCLSAHTPRPSPCCSFFSAGRLRFTRWPRCSGDQSWRCRKAISIFSSGAGCAGRSAWRWRWRSRPCPSERRSS